MKTRITIRKCYILLMVIVCAIFVIFPIQESYAASVKTPKIISISSVNATDIKIKWSSTSGATGYTLYRCTSEKGTYTKIKTLSGTSFTDKGLSAGTLYYYKVRAYKKISGKNVYSNYSAFKTGMPLPVPAFKSVASASKTEIKLAWNAVSGVSGYKLYRSTSEKGTYKFIKTVTTTSFKDTGLKEGKAYYYKILAYKKVKSGTYYSAYSKYKAAMPLSIPSITKVETKSDSEISITWKAISGVSGYTVYRSKSAKGAYSAIKKLSSTKYTDTGLTANTTYYYKISCYKTVSGVSFNSYSSSYKEGKTANNQASSPFISLENVGLLTFDASANTHNLRLRSNVAWSASITVPWISVSPQNGGSGNYDIVVSVQKNNEQSARTGKIQYVGDGGAKWTIEVKQSGAVPPSSTLGISNATAPSGDLSLGNSFTLKGVVSSNYTITSLTAGIYDSMGNATGEVKTVAPGATSYNLSAIDADIHFNYLPIGSGYEYRVTASDASGTTKTLLSSNFNIVTNSTLSISGETKPTNNIVLGSSFGLRGIITSNYKIVSVRATVYTAAGAVTSEDCTVIPNTTTYDLHGVINNSITFGHLPAGDYVYKVWAKDESGYEKTLVESSFKIIVPDSLFTTSQIDTICANYTFINGYYWSYNTSTGSSTAYTATTHKANTTTSDQKDPPRPGEAGYYGYRFAGGAECWAFAGFIGYKLSGVLNPYANWRKYTSLDAVVNAGGLKVGDIIRSSTHSVVVYKISGSSVKFIECWGGSNNKISVNGYFNGDGSTDSLDEIVSKYGFQYVLRYVE